MILCVQGCQDCLSLVIGRLRRLKLLLNFETFCLSASDQRAEQRLGKGAFPTQGFDNLCPEHFKLTRCLCVVGPDAAEQRPPLVHLFLVADIDDLAFGNSLHPFKDLAHQLINDAVKGMGGVARLTVTFGLLAGFTVANIADSLHNAVGIVLARISLAVGGQRESGAAMPTKHVPGQ